MHVVERRGCNLAVSHAGLQPRLDFLIAIKRSHANARTARRHDLSELLPPVSLLIQPCDGETESLRHPGEVRESQTGARRRPKFSAEEIPLSLSYREVSPVVENHNEQVGAPTGKGLQLLQVQHEGAVAGETDHR